MALTQKQEAFALAYFETGNASEAYRRAYNAENMKPESINRKHDPDIPRSLCRCDDREGAWRYAGGRKRTAV